MELVPNQTIHGFTVKSREALPELEGEAYVLEHDKSKARVLYLKNDDNNKAFSIGFRTPPQDDTGVFHILEHSVLCGSRKFPVKEPFVDLLKGSMQTFLNAMTFPDKTVYPVASTNEQDLYNLMDVYLDAVFHPNIYVKRQEFEQEGWHLELSAKDADSTAADAGEADVAALDANQTKLEYNGVVFNEMKGALSDAESVLYDQLQFALFPNTAYACESGGTPEGIPTLTYENYLDEHRRHYRLDNSYTTLYGNLDIDRALAFLDESYFSPVFDEECEADAAREQAGLEPLRPRTLSPSAPVKALDIVKTMDTAPENAMCATAYVIGPSTDPERIIATDILVDALFGSNEAPMKRALLDAGIAEDVSAFIADAIQQPFVVVEAQKPLVEDPCGRLTALVEDNLRALLDAGLDTDLVEASLSHAEFVRREHALGAADGVMYAIGALSGWLYDDDRPLDFLRYEDTFAKLRQALDTDYFEQLARQLFLGNPHMASAQIVPQQQEGPTPQAQELARMNQNLTPEERRKIVDEEALLREIQEKPDTPEDIATLPRLALSDIGDAPEDPRMDLDWKTPLTCLRHQLPTNGIVYAYRYFDMTRLPFEDMPYVSILSLVLGKLPTQHHTAAEIDTLANGKLGNLGFFADIYSDRENVLEATANFAVSASALSENAEWLATLPREIILESDFTDLPKIKDALLQRRIELEQSFAAEGHTRATVRARAHYTSAGLLADTMENVEFYRFLKDLLAHFDERGAELSARLADVANRLFVDNGCTVSFAGTDADYDRFWLAHPQTDRKSEAGRLLTIPKPTMAHEAFIVPTDVSYTALGFDRKILGLPFTGAWAPASRALTLDFLWNEVRVKGGAYGVGFQATRIGNMRFYTYRDPHLDESLERFAKAVPWLASFDPTPEDMTGYQVSSVATMDEPQKPRRLIRRQDTEFFSKRLPSERIKARSEIIEATVEGIRALAEPLQQVIEQGAVCTFGNKDIIASSKRALDVVDLLNE